MPRAKRGGQGSRTRALLAPPAVACCAPKPGGSAHVRAGTHAVCTSMRAARTVRRVRYILVRVAYNTLAAGILAERQNPPRKNTAKAS